MPAPKIWIARRTLAAAASLAAAVSFQYGDGGPLPFALWLPTVLLGLAAGAQLHRHVGSQLLARAVWWSNLLLGTLLSVSGSESDRALGGRLALATGVALLAVGRRGLDETDAGGFAPVAYRGSLMAVMVMAVADAQSLLLFGTLQVTVHKSWHDHGVAALPLVLGFAMLAAIAGLYRLKLWGLVLNVVTNLGVIGFALGGVLDLPRPLLWAYVATSGLQIALVSPLMLAIISGRGGGRGRGAQPAGRSWSGSFAVTACVIAAMMAISAYCVYLRHSSIWHI